MALLQAEGLSKTFTSLSGIFRHRVHHTRALKNISFTLEEGRSLGLVGESGSGKTTLGRLLARLLSPDQGRLLWEGRPAEEFSALEWAGRVQMIFQDPAASLNPKHSVKTLLEEPLRTRARLDGETSPSPARLRERAEELLGTVGLPPDIFFYYPHQFSGGQKQRLAIARALALKPRVLVADEPVSALDLSIQAQILNLLMELKERYHLTTVVISHDLAVVGQLAEKVLVLKDGEAVEDGDTAAVLSNPRHPYTQTLLDAVPRLLR